MYEILYFVKFPFYNSSMASMEGNVELSTLFCALYGKL